MALSAGMRLGTFEIVDQLGVGGMGEVYRAVDTKLAREVAIKTLPAELAKDEDRLARFDREAKLLAALNHAHIASVYSLDEEAGMLFLAMEFVEGETLEQRLEAGALPVEDALRLALQIAEALEAAHEKGVVHRDLKPANIMITTDGQVKVLDFGLAKAFSGNANEASLAHSPALSLAMTQQGLILGTAGYMSPEQASGQATDQRADVWAFGVVLYELLTGLPLFSGESVPHILAAVLQTEPDWNRLPANLHPRLKLLLVRCLEKKVRNRYHTIADARVDIEQVLADPAGAIREPGVQAPPRGTWRQSLPVGLAALIVGAAVGGGAVWTQLGLRSSEPARVSRYLITPPTTQPLSRLNGVELDLSPDGTRLAYIAENPLSGDRLIYLRELSSLDARLLPGTEGASDLFFSPDGASIGFSVPGDGIKKVAIAGGSPVEIVDGYVGYGASWAADDTLVFAGSTTGGTPDALFRVSTTGGGTAQRITRDKDASEMSGIIVGPVLLPGDRAVLFSISGNNDQRVALLDLETGEERILIDDARDAHYVSSGHLVFTRGGLLMAAPFDLDRLNVTGEPVSVLPAVRYPGGQSAADFVVSRSGTLAYVPSEIVESPFAEAVWVGRDGRVIASAVDEPIDNPRDPRLSPGGGRLLLTTGPAGDGQLWIYDLGGRPPIPLVDDADNRLAVWSPDGSDVAFASNRSGSANLYVIDSDGGELDPSPLRAEPLTAAPASWSADGELILLTLNSNQADIGAMAAEADAEIRDIVATDDAEYDAALSPDGRWLAYVSNRTGGAEIWVKRYPDGVPVRVSRNGGIEPRWSGSGEELFYLQGDSMMAVAVEAAAEFSFGAAVELFAEPYFVERAPTAHSYDVAADGRFLRLQRVGGNPRASPATSIVVVENWSEELAAIVPVD